MVFIRTTLHHWYGHDSQGSVWEYWAQGGSDRNGENCINERCCDLYCSQVSLWSSNERHWNWLGMWHVWGEKRIADRILVGLPGRKTFFGRPWHIWRKILKQNLKIYNWVLWTDQLWVLVKMVMSLHKRWGMSDHLITLAFFRGSVPSGDS